MSAPLHPHPLSTAARRLWDRLFHTLLPAWCLSCDTPFGWPTPPFALCDGCRSSLRPPVPACPLCGGVLPPRPDAWLCVACSRHPPAFDALVAAWRYEPPAAFVLQALKFHAQDFLADDIAAALVAAHGTGRLADHEGLTAVPLHWRRRLERGYDQADLLATALARRLSLPRFRLLRRGCPTPPQTSLGGDARRRNLADAFELRRSAARARGARLLLVDDVCTTGATLDAASSRLREAGAARITAVVGAITPRRAPAGSVRFAAEPSRPPIGVPLPDLDTIC